MLAGFPDWIDNEPAERDGNVVLRFWAKEIGKNDDSCVFAPASLSAADIAESKGAIISVLADSVMDHRHPDLGPNVFHKLNLRYFEAAFADPPRPQDMTQADFALFEEYAALTGSANPLAMMPPKKK